MNTPRYKRPSWRHGNRQYHQLQRLGSSSQTQARLQKLLRKYPHHLKALHLLGQIAEEHIDADLAIPTYKQAAYLDRRNTHAPYRLGVIYYALHQLVPAFIWFGETLARNPKPDNAEVFMRFARLMSLLKHDDQAIRFYIQALEIEPDNAKIYVALSELLNEQGDLKRALDCFTALYEIQPHKLDMVSLMMGYTLERNGEAESAVRCYQEALKNAPNQILWHLKKEMTYTFIMQSRAQIEYTFQHCQQVLKNTVMDIEQHPIFYRPFLDEFPLSMIQGSMIYTAYHHYNPLVLRQWVARLARLVIRKKPMHPPSRPVSFSDRPHHLGLLFTSANINLCFTYKGNIVNLLDPDRFKITILCQSSHISQLFTEDNVLQITHPNANWHTLPVRYEEAAKEIQKQQLDTLFYTETSWDFFQYNLTLLRPAPVQCTTWMNPGTTGLKEMDFYFSSDLIEPENGQDHYAETLVRFQNLPVCMPLFERLYTMPRSDFGFEDDWHIYCCPQNILKFHPEFDPILGEILRRDPHGRLVMVATHKQSHLRDLLMQRFQKTIPDVMDRIWVLPQLKNQEFLNLLANADIILDPFYYGGGTTSYQAMALGKAIVTWPSANMVGRITAGMYRRINVLDTICETWEQYIDKALELGQASDYRADLEARIKAASPVLFKDHNVVKEYERFFLGEYHPYEYQSKTV